MTTMIENKLQNSNMQQAIQRAIESLGGTIATHFSKDVDWVVLDDSGSDNVTELSARMGKSRPAGKRLYNMIAQAPESSLRQTAMNLGVAVASFQDVRHSLRKLGHHLREYMRNSHKESPKYVPGKDIAGRLGGDFLVVEDLSGRCRPMVLQFASDKVVGPMPLLDKGRSSLFESPFRTQRSYSLSQYLKGSLTSPQLLAKITARRKHDWRTQERVNQYPIRMRKRICEICQVEADDIHRHLQKRSHKIAVSRSTGYELVDSLISEVETEYIQDYEDEEPLWPYLSREARSELGKSEAVIPECFRFPEEEIELQMDDDSSSCSGDGYFTLDAPIAYLRSLCPVESVTENEKRIEPDCCEHTKDDVVVEMSKDVPLQSVTIIDKGSDFNEKKLAQRPVLRPLSPVAAASEDDEQNEKCDDCQTANGGVNVEKSTLSPVSVRINEVPFLRLPGFEKRWDMDEDSINSFDEHMSDAPRDVCDVVEDIMQNVYITQPEGDGERNDFAESEECRSIVPRLSEPSPGLPCVTCNQEGELVANKSRSSRINRRCVKAPDNDVPVAFVEQENEGRTTRPPRKRRLLCGDTEVNRVTRRRRARDSHAMKKNQLIDDRWGVPEYEEMENFKNPDEPKLNVFDVPDGDMCSGPSFYRNRKQNHK